ncbi:BamA/TamA family outer membrane protein [Chitinophaga tropicalis]|uniref:BamA/TamA family outer membrane protein n=1 Tax=Chitinophaga tropicalis TaxID=2683588 RepID=A0A7K1U7P9_9BACT|nr:BamA/TamA family outer membrane protein [Chitinophaga tropicalis]MVT10384.1 BamA/TamA family outer membrane protein [Chitinophaga tropicalis]
MKKYLLILLIITPVCVFAQKKTDSLRQKYDYGADEDTVPRKDLIDLLKNVVHIKSDRLPKKGKRRIYYSLVPVPTNVPGGGTALITSTNAAFYLGPRRTTNLSNITFSPSFSFSGRFSFSFKSNVWLEGNRYNMAGDMRFAINPQYTWGLGNGVPQEERQLLNNNYFRFYETVYRKVKPGLLAGIGYHLDWYSAIRVPGNDSLDLPEFVRYKYGTEQGTHSVSSGISLNLLKDSRQNSINPQSGHYFNAVFRVNRKFLGSYENWESLYLDYRRYIRFGDGNTQNVLALWGYYWTSLSSKTPYLDLPSIGWDPANRSGRGITQNRFRGRGLIDLEAEYRRDITRNGLLGFTVFANMNTVTQPDEYRFTRPHPAVGAGLRIKFNKKSGTNLAFDYGVSKYGSRFSLNLGEAF